MSDMIDQDKVLAEIAVKALNGLVASASSERHRELWKLAVARVHQTWRDVAQTKKSRGRADAPNPG